MWEYLLLKLENVIQKSELSVLAGPMQELNRFRSGLNVLGREGWELCIMLPPPTDMMVFKRKCPEKVADASASP